MPFYNPLSPHTSSFPNQPQRGLTSVTPDGNRGFTPNMTIYISGPISAIPIKEAYKRFNNAQSYLQKLGHKVINPMTHDHNHGRSWAEYMIEDLTLLMKSKCNAIYMLKDWNESPGAQIEHIFAKTMNLKIIYQ